MSKPCLRVVVVAEYPAVRAGLRELLVRAGLEVVREFAPRDLGGGGFEPADVWVADAGDATAGLFESADAPVLILTDDLTGTVAAAAEGPPGGYVHRDASGEVLAAAARAVAAGMLVVDPALGVGDLSFGASAMRTAAAGALTDRELEVLRLVTDGLPNKGIALQLGISEHTVKFHVSSILGKLDVASRTEAVTEAVRRGLLAL